MTGDNTTAAATPGAERAPPPASQVLAVVIGNALEFFDFLAFAFFAAQIGRTFFPSDQPILSLLASLATFGAGFLTRPLGAFVIGRMADRVGRKPAMLLTFTLMGVAMLGIGLTPGFAAIGVIAPVLAVTFRLIQGFALGGEVGPNTAFLIEAAPVSKRARYVSLQYVSQSVAVLAAGGIGVALAHYLTPADLDLWGWRVPFLIGAIIVPFGFMLRRTLVETLPDHEAEEAAFAGADGAAPAPRAGYARLAILGLMLLASGTVISYLLTYFTTYASSTLGMADDVAFGATVVNGLTGAVFCYVGGMLADRFGRKPVMMWPHIAMMMLVLPCYWAIEHFRTAEALYGVTFLLVMLASISAVPVLVAITESLPARVRAGSLAMIYAVAISVFGGSTQFVVAWLGDLLHDPLTPAWYMLTFSAAGLLAMLALPESAPGKIRRRG
ncbi:MAG: MFS transporter [Caulobacter sp.]|nr:MFS transporter [Caulobacter sp.]